VEVKTIAHKGLRRFIEDGVTSGLPAAPLAKIATIVSFLDAAPGVEAIQKLQTWKAHQLTGDRKGTWSLTVTRNWRITFAINEQNEIEDLDFEDYH
jgi:proteic killer suppression protein